MKIKENHQNDFSFSAVAINDVNKEIDSPDT